MKSWSFSRVMMFFAILLLGASAFGMIHPDTNGFAGSVRQDAGEAWKTIGNAAGPAEGNLALIDLHADGYGFASLVTSKHELAVNPGGHIVVVHITTHSEQGGLRASVGVYDLCNAAGNEMNVSFSGPHFVELGSHEYAFVSSTPVSSDEINKSGFGARIFAGITGDADASFGIDSIEIEVQ